MASLSRKLCSFSQLSTSGSLTTEQLKSSVPSLHDADPNAATKIEYFTGSVERSPPHKLSKIDDVKHDKENHKTKTLSQIRPYLDAIEQNMSFRIRKRRISLVINKDANGGRKIPFVEEPRFLKIGSLVSEEDLEEEFYDVERPNAVHNASSNDSTMGDFATNYASPHGSYAGSCAWKEELESLVRGGVFMALIKEVKYGRKNNLNLKSRAEGRQRKEVERKGEGRGRQRQAVRGRSGSTGRSG